MYKFKTLKNREQLTDTIDIKRSKNIQVGWLSLWYCYNHYWHQEAEKGHPEVNR